MNIRHLRIGVLAAVCAFGVACGGDADSTSAGGTVANAGAGPEADAPTREEYIAQADGICQKYSANEDEFEIDLETDPASTQRYFQEMLGFMGKTVDEIRDLTLPEGDAGTQIDAALDDVGQAMADFEKLISTPEGAGEYVAALLMQMFASADAPPSTADGTMESAENGTDPFDRLGKFGVDAEDQAPTPEGTTESAAGPDPFAGIGERFSNLGFADCFSEE